MSLPTEQTSATKRSKYIVVKVGGSLLARSDLPQLLNSWLNAQAAEKIILLAGGGELVEAIRQQDVEQNLGPSAAHWLAIQVMQQTAEYLASLLPGVPLAHATLELRQTFLQQERVVFNALPFLREEEPHLSGVKLPEHWDVSSDSIAARLAIVVQADELVLLKSCSPSSDDKLLQALSDSGYLDRFLPSLEAELPEVRLVDLPGGREVLLQDVK